MEKDPFAPPPEYVDPWGTGVAGSGIVDPWSDYRSTDVVNPWANRPAPKARRPSPYRLDDVVDPWAGDIVDPWW